MELARTGRPKLYCSDACRILAHRRAYQAHYGWWCERRKNRAVCAGAYEWLRDINGGPTCRRCRIKPCASDDYDHRWYEHYVNAEDRRITSCSGVASEPMLQMLYRAQVP
jgi:hypothetical protein